LLVRKEDMMSGGKHGHISKGRVHTKVDALLNHRSATGNFDQRAAFKAALLGAGPMAADYLQILQNPPAGVNPGDINYLRDTWYNEGPNGWWPWLQPIHLIIRYGLIKAIDLADQNRDPAGNLSPLPIDSYWAPCSDQVEVILTVSAQQVTRIILTPPSPEVPPRRQNPARMWNIRRGSGQEVAAGPGHIPTETNDEIVESVDTQHRIVTWREKEF
jgi:hypothetical protein